MLSRTSFALRRAVAATAGPAASVSRTSMARRAFSVGVVARGGGHGHHHAPEFKVSKSLTDIKTTTDLLGEGAAPGTVPTDYEQATGLERLEILGKMEGVDVFDMKPLDASRLGTLENPIIAKSFGDEHYVGCTGYPADSHVTMWLTLSKDRPVERCPECGNVIKMEYVGAPDDEHSHDHPIRPADPKTMADFVKPEYY